MAKITNLQALLVSTLQDLHDAERQLVAALSRFAGAAHDAGLAAAFAAHLTETRGHVGRVEQGLALLLAARGARRCAAMHGMIATAHARVSGRVPATLRDAAMIAYAQKFEHYEIASYTAALRIAENLGYAELAALLRTTLEEERACDRRLTEISRSLNPLAAPASPRGPARKKTPLLAALRAILPGRFGDGGAPARRPRKFDAAAENFSGQRTNPRAASRSAAPRTKRKRRRHAAARRKKPARRADTRVKKRSARRKTPPRTDD